MLKHNYTVKQLKNGLKLLDIKFEEEGYELLSAFIKTDGYQYYDNFVKDIQDMLNDKEADEETYVELCGNSFILEVYKDYTIIQENFEEDDSDYEYLCNHEDSFKNEKKECNCGECEQDENEHHCHEICHDNKKCSCNEHEKECRCNEHEKKCRCNEHTNICSCQYDDEDEFCTVDTKELLALLKEYNEKVNEMNKT